MIWWTKSWNPVIGCTPCSPACDNCYAEALHTQRHKALLAGKKMAPCYSTPFAQIRRLPERLTDPLHWRKPQRIFVGNMGDLFHDAVPLDWMIECLTIMAMSRRHTYMLLTKRPERAQHIFSLPGLFEHMVQYAQKRWGWEGGVVCQTELQGLSVLPNVWLGTTIWDQASADRAVPILLSTPAAKRFVSVEPMLGPVDLYGGDPDPRLGGVEAGPGLSLEDIDWVICGGETGKHARPMHPDWPRSLRDQCQGAEVPFFFKQWGEWAPWDFEYTADGAFNRTGGRDHYVVDSFAGGKPMRMGRAKAGRRLDGRTWEEVPHAHA